MAPSLTRITIYTTIAITAYFITYTLLIQSFTPNPDLQLIKITSGITGVTTSLIIYQLERWTRKKLQKGTQWTKQKMDKAKENLENKT